MTHPVTTPTSRRGFTLLEVMVALGLLAGAVLAVAQLLVVAARASQSVPGQRRWRPALAAQKLEQLQSLAWGYAVDGAPVDDLALSPPGALAADTAGSSTTWTTGEWPWAAACRLRPRRCSRGAGRVEPDDGRVPPRTIVLRVVVLRREASRARSSSGTTSWIETIRLVGVRTRRPS